MSQTPVGSSPTFRPFELENLPTVAEARARWMAAVPRGIPGSELVDLGASFGRVLAQDVRALEPVPRFPRSTVDGVAMRSDDTRDASHERPTTLRVKGKIAMGSEAPFALKPGEAALVPTGGMLPEGADAVVMVEEFPDLLEDGQTTPDALDVARSVRAGENVIPVGADVQLDQVVVPAGTRLHAHHLGVLAALGHVSVSVRRRPEVALLSTGEELVPPERTPKFGQIRDMNASGLAALIEEAGGRVRRLGIVGDDKHSLKEAMLSGLQSDMLVLSGGSSVGEEDWAARLVAELGSPGVIVHGVKLAPGKPTLCGLIGDKPVLGVPGNPVSALVVFRLFGVPALRILAGETDPPMWSPVVPARLTRDARGTKGRELHMRVALTDGAQGWLATPITGGSHQLMTMVRADGVIVIPAGEVIPEGSRVDVHVW